MWNHYDPVLSTRGNIAQTTLDEQMVLNAHYQEKEQTRTELTSMWESPQCFLHYN